MSYRGVITPIRMQTDGNLQVGTRRETIRSDIRMILSGRRFVNRTSGGDRLMRPGYGSIFKNQLIRLFDDDSLIPVSRSEVRQALSILESESLIRINQINATAPRDGALEIRIDYTDLVNNTRDVYDFEIQTELPRETGDRG